jgi:hypothetical protein
VTIEGNNFVDVTAVRFAGVNASFSVFGDSVIATVPDCQHRADYSGHGDRISHDRESLHGHAAFAGDHRFRSAERRARGTG